VTKSGKKAARVYVSFQKITLGFIKNKLGAVQKKMPRSALFPSVVF
jgi:hypothetical protein